MKNVQFLKLTDVFEDATTSGDEIILLQAILHNYQPTTEDKRFLHYTLSYEELSIKLQTRKAMIAYLLHQLRETKYILTDGGIDVDEHGLSRLSIDFNDQIIRFTLSKIMKEYLQSIKHRSS